MNEAYQFSVEPLAGHTTCGPVEYASNHGVLFLLDTTDCGRDVLFAERVAVIANYNVAWEVRSSRGLGRHLCDGARVQESKKTVGAVKFLRCDAKSEDGLSRTLYFALRPRAGAVGITMEVNAYCRPHNKAICQRMIDEAFRKLRFQ